MGEDEPEGARLGVTGAGLLLCTVLGLYGLINGLSSLLGRLVGVMVDIKEKGGVSSAVKVKEMLLFVLCLTSQRRQ